jgi:hypothetical protein
MYKERVAQAVEAVKARVGRLMRRARGGAPTDLGTAGGKPQPSSPTGRGPAGEERRQRGAGSAGSGDTR